VSLPGRGGDLLHRTWSRAREWWTRGPGGDSPANRPGAFAAGAADLPLFEGLQQLLRLVERLPRTPRCDDVRRSACELIEANTDRQREETLHRLQHAIGHAGQSDGIPVRGADGMERPNVEQLTHIVSNVVGPLLRHRRVGARGRSPR
jgi:hypothetical protein